MLVLPVPGGPHKIIDDNLPGRDHPPDGAFGAGQMFLADNIGKLQRAKLIGKRCVGAQLFGRDWQSSSNRSVMSARAIDRAARWRIRRI